MDIYWVEKFPIILQVASLLIVFVILAVFGQRKTWISTEIIMAAAVGTGMTLFPRYLLNFQPKNSPLPYLTSVSVCKPIQVQMIKTAHGNMEELLGRLYGITLLTSCMTWWRTKNSLDATVQLTVMLSRLFLGSVLLMTQLFVIASEMKKSSGLQFSEQFVPAFVLPTALWLLGNVLHLARSNDFNTYPRYNVRVNHHLRADAFLQFLLGVAWLAFPGHIFPLLLTEKKTTNRVIMHIGRSIGALALGEAIISLQAAGFLNNDDKKQLLLTRIVMSISQFVAVLVSCAYLDTITVRLLLVLSSLTLPSLLNGLIGFFSNGTTVYQMPPPASPAKQVDNKTL